jgi:endonuclease/exonuclease/phosphatase family metal-dependent hydrolase
VPLLVRTWNLFHGNAVPPERRAYLEEMVRLATADEPDVLCLQEVPVWAVGRLGGWSGMSVAAAVAARPRLGSAQLGRVLTDLHHGLLRSAFTGQANATLVRRGLRAQDEQVWEISRPGEGERRLCQALRIPEVGLVGNFHTTGTHADEQFRRAAVLVDELAAGEEPVVLCGDANVEPAGGRTYDELRERGYSDPAPGIDQILVRGAPSTPAVVWPEERRRADGRLLSDHAPVELHVG